MEMTEYTCFKIAVADYIATVTMSRLPVNAQNNAFRDEIISVFDVLSDRKDVRAIILTSEAKVFSAGADMKDRPTDQPGAFQAHNRRVRASFDCLLECPKPIIAAVNSAAIGAGCVTALCADIIVVSETAFMSMPEVTVGFAGGVSHVRRHFGESDARLLILTARRIFGAELMRMNVASACVPPQDLMTEAMAIARDIVKNSPSALKAAKKSFQVTEELSIYDGYRFEQGQTAALAETDDTREALAAFREKRAPRFADN